MTDIYIDFLQLLIQRFETVILFDLKKYGKGKEKVGLLVLFCS